MLNKIRIKLESFNSKLINQALNQIIQGVKVSEENASKGSIVHVGLPTEKRIYCLLRSPHVNKDSREHFEIRSYKILIDISTEVPNPLLNIRIPGGVTATIKS
nr:ribosomal protein S10 [Meringosphaera mediterranea]